MKTIEDLPVAQGDCILIPIDEIPTDAIEQPHQSRLVVAHSETGHHHAIDADGVVRFAPADPLVCYLRVEGPWADLVHERPWDTHETVRLPGGGRMYAVHRQREETPEGWRAVQD